MNTVDTVDTLTRIELNRILFATDFSPAAGAAIPYAAALTKRYGAKLYVVHVRPAVEWVFTPVAGWQVLEQASKIDMARAKREILAFFPDSQPEVLLTEGTVWRALRSIISANEIDLIVIGTRGRSGIAKLLLGSTAEEILRKARCPVLTVGPHALARANTGEFRKVLFATDFSSESLPASYAVSLAQEYQASLILMHVVERRHPADFSWAAHLLDNLVTSEAEFWCTPECVVETGDPAEKICEVASERQAELIVMGAHQTGGLGPVPTHLAITTAHKVVSRAPCPVLTVRS
jgi:nucleotide-binding universal stress UspA family protein